MSGALQSNFKANDLTSMPEFAFRLRHPSKMPSQRNLFLNFAPSTPQKMAFHRCQDFAFRLRHLTKLTSPRNCDSASLSQGILHTMTRNETLRYISLQTLFEHDISTKLAKMGSAALAEGPSR